MMRQGRKRGVSEIVAYVLLISITLTIAGMVFGWLKYYVNPAQEIKCDDGVSLAIRGYAYNCSGSQQNLSITLQNRGMFDVAGYILRVNNVSEFSKVGVLTINSTGKPMVIGESYVDVYNEINKTVKGTIYFIEVQPFRMQNGKVVYCKDVMSRQSLKCS